MNNQYDICTFNEISIVQKMEVLDSIKNIFFESSSVKEFKDFESKDVFFKRWCGDYLTHYPQYFYLMFENNKLLGYLSGCLSTNDSLSVLNVPGVQLFSDLYEDFPAHLHINFSAECRGKGLGSILVEHFLGKCRLKQIKGVHLITSLEAKNVTFYRRLGFNKEFPRLHSNFTQLFMGMILE